MNGKYIVYALLVTLFSTMATWGRFVGSAGGMRGGGGWSSHTGGAWGGGGSWGGGGGGHK